MFTFTTSISKLLMPFICLLLLTACSNTPEEKPSETEKSAEATPAEKIPKAGRTAEEMITQKPGWLMKKHFDKDIEAVKTIDWYKYRNFYDDTFKPIMEKEVGNYFQEHKNLTSDEVYDYLVYTLGSGQYERFYEPLSSFDHGFQAPDLPTGEDTVEKEQKQANVVVLMDASGSMKAEVPGGVKMDLAKETIQAFASELPKETNISLLAYGHVGTGSDADKVKSCQAIESVFPLAKYDKASFNEAADSFQASGWTPLAGAINKASDILSAYPSDEYANIVYIVSDGVETCDGDPVAAAKKLQVQNIQAKVNIIGFNVDDPGQKQLKEVAEAGDGEYVTVKTKNELETQIIKKWRPSIFEIIGKQGVPLSQYANKTAELIDYKVHLTDLSNYEKSRIVNAVYFLHDKDLIDEKIKEEVKSLAEEMNELRNEHFTKLHDIKKQELEDAKNDIDQEVSEWKEQWEE
ncbi:VWA domain-containing protein [Bacillus aerolatus]|uniref:VWA domain-containing protein n=1 Tax=Bacillus aerolatus TaxID=2653354 RepID=A0A6I1FJ39_9BACI|nr:VWA domain-containing protein [Bacillus aerolatus]KAB7706538.1 VWA domain-containing protein [Bacillus aerolatus]